MENNRLQNAQSILRTVWTSALSLGVIATLTLFVAGLAPVEALTLRPAFFTGKWASEAELCTASSGFVEMTPGHFKYAGALDHMPGKITYYQAKWNMVDVGIANPALTAKITFMLSEGVLFRTGAEITLRELGEAEWQHLARISNGTMSKAAVEAKVARFKAEVASYPERLVRCAASN